MNEKLFGKQKKTDTEELCKLRDKVLEIDGFFKKTLYFHIICVIVFVGMLFKIAYGISLTNGGDASAPIAIGIAAIVAMLPLIMLSLSAYCKSKKAIIALIAAMSALFLLCFAFSCMYEIQIVFILVPIYITAICSVFYKNNRFYLPICALCVILYCILSLNNDINNVNYPHILLLLSVILNIVCLKRHKEYTELSKIYGFPYFNERFNEQSSEYTPERLTSDFAGNAPDDIDINQNNETDELLKPYTPKQPSTMETINCDIDIDTVCDVPLANTDEVEAYTQRLRELKNKKR